MTNQLDELIGTKLRALYQRRKGRDLFDIHKALTVAEIHEDKVIECYLKYMGFVVDHIPTYKEFILNMEDKMQDDEFLGDTAGLLKVGDNFIPEQSYSLVKERLIDKLQK